MGFELDPPDPIYMLRKQLLSLTANTHTTRPGYYKAALIIKAWNAFQMRDTIQQLKFSDGETWPEISRRRGRLSEEKAKENRTKQARRRRQLQQSEASRRKKAATKKKTKAKAKSK